jgi:hypothetical protein
MHLADTVGLAGIEQNTLGSCGFSGIDVGHDADIAGKSEIVLLCHFDRSI